MNAFICIYICTGDLLVFYTNGITPRKADMYDGSAQPCRIKSLLTKALNLSRKGERLRVNPLKC